MGLRSLATAGGHMLLATGAVVAGLLVAFVSQASSPDYRVLVGPAVGLATVSGACALGFAAVVRGWAKWLPLTAAGLGAAGAFELVTRVYG